VPAFIKAVINNDYNLPKSVKSLNEKDKKVLKDQCSDLNQIYCIFSSVGNIAPHYCNKESYAIKRISELVLDESLYSDDGI
jgi:hypothetical protein